MRASIGLIAGVLLIVGMAAHGGQADEAVSGPALRVGILMGLWWLAYPQVERIPRWFALACGAAVLLVLRWPKLILPAIPLLIVLWFLRPRTSGAQKSR